MKIDDDDYLSRIQVKITNKEVHAKERDIAALKDAERLLSECLDTIRPAQEQLQKTLAQFEEGLTEMETEKADASASKMKRKPSSSSTKGNTTIQRTELEEFKEGGATRASATRRKQQDTTIVVSPQSSASSRASGGGGGSGAEGGGGQHATLVKSVRGGDGGGGGGGGGGGSGASSAAPSVLSPSQSWTSSSSDANLPRASAVEAVPMGDGSGGGGGSMGSSGGGAIHIHVHSTPSQAEERHTGSFDEDGLPVEKC